jgi:hypothetical protein
MRSKRDELPKSVAMEISRWRSDGRTWAEIKDEFDITAVTAKALLKNHGLDHSPNGANRKVTEKWSRPCINCAKKERRSRGLFMCKACRQTNREHYDASDSMYHGHPTHL